jgi:hypothetical protein
VIGDLVSHNADFLQLTACLPGTSDKLHWLPCCRGKKEKRRKTQVYAALHLQGGTAYCNQVGPSPLPPSGARHSQPGEPTVLLNANATRPVPRAQEPAVLYKRAAHASLISISPTNTSAIKLVASITMEPTKQGVPATPPRRNSSRSRSRICHRPRCRRRSRILHHPRCRSSSATSSPRSRRCCSYPQSRRRGWRRPLRMACCGSRNSSWG